MPGWIAISDRCGKEIAAVIAMRPLVDGKGRTGTTEGSEGREGANPWPAAYPPPTFRPSAILSCGNIIPSVRRAVPPRNNLPVLPVLPVLSGLPSFPLTLPTQAGIFVRSGNRSADFWYLRLLRYSGETTQHCPRRHCLRYGCSLLDPPRMGRSCLHVPRFPTALRSWAPGRFYVNDLFLVPPERTHAT